MTEHNQVSKRQLSQKLEDTGVPGFLTPPAVNDNTPLLKGKIQYNALPSGLMVHATDAEEQMTTHCGSELAPSVMVSVVLNGSVTFALDDQQFHIDSGQGARVFAYVVNQPMLFTRSLQRGNKLKKVNVSASRDWLLSRCSHQQLEALRHRLLSQPCLVRDWPADQAMQQLSDRIINAYQQQDLLSRLQCESSAFELFNHCFEHFFAPDELATPSTPSPVNWPLRYYEQKIDALVCQPLTTEQIAAKIGASKSTLQRYFKANHHKSLAEYIRSKRLESARRALLFEQVSISEAAFNAGYRHVSNFVTAFKRQFDKTPNQMQIESGLK